MGTKTSHLTLNKPLCLLLDSMQGGRGQPHGHQNKPSNQFLCVCCLIQCREGGGSRMATKESTAPLVMRSGASNPSRGGQPPSASE
jgi:hypothetical protein